MASPKRVALLRLFLLLNPHYRDLCEALFKRGGLQLGGHAAHDVFRDDTVPALMAIEADFEWYIEKHGVDFVVVILGKLDPVLPLLRSQVRGIHVVHGSLGNEACFQHGAQVGKHEILKALLANVVKQK
jgi:hypothetical protein